MKKSYSVDGKVYDFTDVHMECGMLCGQLRDKLPHGARYYQRGRW